MLTENNIIENQKEMKISWSDLSYSVRTKLSKSQRKAQGTVQKYAYKEILKSQSGYIKPGETCFIMGSSGAGKTTLLNILWDRISQKKGSKLEGQILLNDSYKVTQKDFGKYGAYVMQDDVMFPTLTCEEIITFSARLQLNLSGKDLRKKVNEVIETLGLSKCRKTTIGNEQIKGLSGGERKRTAIGVELITDPQVLFLDEPTSGLDSFTSQKIVKILVDQSRLGKTVIAIIHQPNSSTFALFDRLILLMDGHCIYQGMAGDAVYYFSSLGFEIPKYSNPADYFLKEFYIPFQKNFEVNQKVKSLLDGYSKNIKHTITAENLKHSDHVNIPSKILHGSETKAGVFTQFKENMVRTLKNMLRNPLWMKIRLIQVFSVCLLSCLVFWNLGYDEMGAKGKIGFCFFISMEQTMAGMMGVLLVFIEERPVFLREYANNTYGLIPYYLSKCFVEVPFQLWFPVVTALLTYFSLNFTAELDKFLIFTLILMVVLFIATSVGFFLGWLFDDQSKATSGQLLVIIPYFVFGGYVINLGDVTPFLKWMQYFSPLRYSMEALLRNEFEDNLKYSEDYQTVYELFDFDIGMWESIGILLAMAIVFSFVSLLTLKLSISKVQ